MNINIVVEKTDYICSCESYTDIPSGIDKYILATAYDL